MRNCIYIGAPLAGVNRYQIFTKRPTELIARLMTAYSLIEQLFVSAEYLSAALAEMNQQGTARYLAYQQSLEKREIPAPAVKVAADKIVDNVIKDATKQEKIRR